LKVPLETRRSWVEKSNVLSMRQQCELLELNRSGVYYEPAVVTPENLALMNRIDEIFTERPFYGSRRLAVVLSNEGQAVNRKRVQRLMRLMGIEAIYPKPRLTVADKQHEKYPYLLRGVDVTTPDQVWASDITYIRLRQGFLYLTAILDWYSRYVLAWRLSNTLDSRFCVEALEMALGTSTPQIFNSDQGCQFTSKDFTKVLKSAEVKISMDGKGRAFDNIFVERLWRSVKYEEVYLKDYEGVFEAEDSLGNYFSFYNNERPHQALSYLTPAQVYGQKGVTSIFLN
jgi:putative transposase